MKYVPNTVEPTHRTIFASDFEPVQTKLEATPHGPRLTIKSPTFAASLPATGFVLSLLKRKLKRTVTA